MVRFVQTTYLLLFYDLSWQGTYDGLFVEKKGVAVYPFYDTEIHDIAYFPTFKAVSLWMPMFLFPDFEQMSVAECANSSPLFQYLTPMTFAWLAPLGLWTIGWVGWAVKHQPPLMQIVTKITTAFEGNRKRARRRRFDAALAGHEAADQSRTKRVATGVKDLHRHYGVAVGMALLLAPYFTRQYLLYLTCEFDAELNTTTCATTSSYLTSFYVACFVLAWLGAGVLFLQDPRKDGPWLYLCKGKTQRRKKW